MKKNFLGKITTTILLLLGVLIALYSLISCDNFLKGADIKKEIEETIAYNNAQGCTIVFRADSSMGEFLGSIERTCKVNYEEEVQFELNTEDYVFNGFEAVSQTDKTVSRADCVELNEISKDIKKGIYKYKIKLLRNAKDILIQPVCIAIPKILNISPKFESSGCDQDTPIKITFNKSVKLESFGDFSCISIFAEENLSEYFETPSLINDNKTLCITPKANKLILLPEEQKSSLNIEINYDFTTIKDTDNLSLTEQGVYTYKINKNFGNQKKVLVWLPGNSKYGAFLSTGEKECTVGYTVEIQFTTEKEKFKFLKFEALNKADNSVLGDDCVSFENIDINDSTGICTAKVRVNKEDYNDILINPVCVEWPSVAGYSPVSIERQFANIPIIITFNNPIEGTINQNNILSGLKLTMYGTDVSNYFTTPEFDSQNKTLTIMPKTKKEFGDNSLEVFVENLPNTIIPAVVVSFAADTFINIEGYQIPLKAESFSVSYKADIDLTPPEEYAFFVTRYKTTLESAATLEDDKKFILETINLSGNYYSISETVNAIQKNCSNGKVYIYGYYNIKSGIKNVIVTEQRTHDTEGTEVADNPKQTVYTKQSEEMKFSTSNTDNLFCIEHQIQQGDENDRNDGAFLMTVVVTGGSGIQSEEKTFTTIKKSTINFDFSDPDDLRFNNGLDFDEKYQNQEVIFDETEFKNGLKHLQIGNITNILGRIYGDIWYSPEGLSLQYKYTGKENFETATPLEDDYYEPLFDINLDVDSVSGLGIQFLVSDAFGNSASFDVEIPSSEDFGYITGYNVDHDRTFRFYHNSGKYVSNIILIKTSPDGTKTAKRYNVYSKEVTIPLEQDCTYQFSPVLAGSTESPGWFWTEIPTDLIISSEFENTTVDEVVLKNVEGTNLPVDFVKSNISGSLRGTIHLADDSWSKFDAIYAKLSLPVKRNNKWEYDSRTVFFEKGNLTASFNILTGSMFEKGCSFTVYGIKGNSESNGTQCVVPQITATTEYDNISPVSARTVLNEDYYKFTISDSHSGPDYGNVLLYPTTDYTGGFSKKYRADVSTGYEALVPIWDILNVRPDYYSYYIEMYDKAGNRGTSGAGGWVQLLPAIQSIQKQEQENTWKLSLTPVSYYGQTYHILNDNTIIANSIDYIYTIDDSDDTYDAWTEWQKQDAGGNSVEQKGLTVTLPQNQMVKIVRKYVRGSSSTTVYYCPPYYFYTGEKSSGEYDLLWPTGSTKTSFAIQSDAPVFVHTLTTEKSYSECKDWSAKDWEFFKKHIGDKYLTFSSTEHNPKRYSIPMDQIADGECYIVIAHFADNHVEMSEIMQK